MLHRYIVTSLHRLFSKSVTMFSRFSKGLVAIIILSLIMAVVDLPVSMKSQWPDSLKIFKNPKVTLGLDLQGGTQLDYKIDLRNANAKNSDDDPTNDVNINQIIDGVRATIERRVNNLGVSEPQIYLSNVGNEQHIVVELAGIKDVEQAKAVVGKTIQLEFKEKKIEMDTNEKGKVQDTANTALESALANGADFDSIGKNTETSDKKIEYRPKKTTFVSELPAHYKDILSKLKEGQVYGKVIEGSDGYTVTEGGQLSEKKGLYIVQLIKSEVKDKTSKKYSTIEDASKEAGGTIETLNSKKVTDFSGSDRDALQIMLDTSKNTTNVVESDDGFRVYNLTNKQEAQSQVKASHILISYKGAQRAAETITRTKVQAKLEAERIYNEIKKNSTQFAELANKYTDDPSGKSNGGDLGYFGQGQMTKAFENAAFTMNVGDISNVVETEFGFHIIKVTDKRQTEESMDLQLLKVKEGDDVKSKLEAAVKKITDGYDVTTQEMQFEYNEIFFDLTPDPWKPTGLDGSHFKFATITYSELGAPEVSIKFDDAGADMFEKITGRLVGQPLAIFVGGELISAPNVNSKISGGSAVITGRFTVKQAMSLANDLNTGAIDAPVILSGQNTISATLGDNALRVSLIAGLIGIIAVALFMILNYRIMGFLAIIALLIYTVIVIFILKTTNIVMTLAGIAGIILSIGMAVDANILIFERTKEELRSGKNFTASITAGFDRAWLSIRDSNVSSLITCAILWFFGNSIIRGFALTLSIGILVSMFTAITVSRMLLHTITNTWLSKNRFLLGVKEVETINR